MLGIFDWLSRIGGVGDEVVDCGNCEAMGISVAGIGWEWCLAGAAVRPTTSDISIKWSRVRFRPGALSSHPGQLSLP